MRFIVDQQLPPLLAERLRARGLDAIHVRELGLSGASDTEIWSEARRDGAVVISRDEDFVARTRRPGGARLVWVRLGNSSNPALLAAVEAGWTEITGRLDAGETLVELRS